MSFLREMEAAAERVERENQGLSAEQIARIDRKIVPRILGHLHIAAETLLEGRISTAEKIKHGMKKLLHAIERKIQEETAASGIGMPPSDYGPDLGVGELTLPAPESVQSWNKFIEILIPEGKSLSASSGSLSPDFKKQLARAIKQGKKLAVGVSSVAGEAQRHIREAWVLYRDLSGECHV